MKRDSYSSLSEDERRKGARDWSHSIQSRLAETLSADIARTSAPEDTLDGAHRATVSLTALAAGVTPLEVEQSLVATASPKSGEFDEPRVRDIIEMLASEIFATMAVSGMPDIKGKLIFESLPSGSVSALCCANSWDDYFHIFIDADLLVFCASISKIVANCFVYGSRRSSNYPPTAQLLKAVKAEDIQLRIKDLFSASVFAGSVRASKPWMPHPKALRLHIILLKGQERFVVAHEIAHVVCGHHSEPDQALAIATPGIDDANSILFSRQAEFEADAVGALLSVRSEEATEHRLLLQAAPYIFMKAVEILELCHAMAGDKARDLHSTHPPAAERSKRIRASLVELEGADDLLERLMQKIDQLFFWISRTAVTEINRRARLGSTPRKKVLLRAFEGSERPAILGILDSPKQVSEVAKRFARDIIFAQVDR
ncbi:M48 family metalloprotease [Shinella kummerowiae]|uniref:M48 family metalloprotease n=1 Tax=Shinella kummerowiae TaxID=417745 RepID=UPI0021B5BC44|nr:M48 family metalloprotease [Shinella kummerowiae]MCT7663539.1 M48 family metalloprotease [Shinella kummerowiae]